PARADFHLTTQACASTTGVAGVGLKESAGTFTFTGSVTCNGAQSVDITSLTFAAAPSQGVRQLGQQVVPLSTPVNCSPASCGPCGPAATVVSGTAPSAPGLYTVQMN